MKIYLREKDGTENEIPNIKYAGNIFIEQIHFVMAKYEYDDKTFQNCPIFEEGWCSFSKSFNEACDKGCAVLGCYKCKIEDSKFIIDNWR